MGFVVPVGIKEPFEKLPPGYVKFKIGQGAEGDVGSAESPQFGLEVEMEAIEPNEVAGVPHRERFFLGLSDQNYLVQHGKAEADPMAENDATLVLTLGKFKAFCSAAGVEIEGKDSDLVFSELKDRKVIGKVEHQTDKKDAKRTNARITRWLPDGTIDPHVTAIPEQAAQQVGNDKAGVAKPAAAAGPRPATPTVATRPTASRLGVRTVGAAK